MATESIQSSFDDDTQMYVEQQSTMDNASLINFLDTLSSDFFPMEETSDLMEVEYPSNASTLATEPENDPILSSTYGLSWEFSKDLDFMEMMSLGGIQPFTEEMLREEIARPMDQYVNLGSIEIFPSQMTLEPPKSAASSDAKKPLGGSNTEISSKATDGQIPLETSNTQMSLETFLETSLETSNTQINLDFNQMPFKASKKTLKPPTHSTSVKPLAKSTPFPSPPPAKGEKRKAIEITQQKAKRSGSIGMMTPDSRNSSYINMSNMITKGTFKTKVIPAINYPPVLLIHYRIIEDSYIEVPTKRTLAALTLSRKWIIRGDEYLEELRKATPPSNPPIGYSRESPTGDKQYYSPEIVRYLVKSNGSQDNESRQGLCPYCVQPNFISLKSSSYTQHLSFVHGINTYGTFPAPRNYKAESNGTHYDHSCECPVCHETMTLKRSTKKLVQPLKKYFRHFREEHLWLNDKVISVNRDIVKANQTAAYPSPPVDVFYRQVPIQKTVASTEVYFETV